MNTDQGTGVAPRGEGIAVWRKHVSPLEATLDQLESTLRLLVQRRKDAYPWRVDDLWLIDDLQREATRASEMLRAQMRARQFGDQGMDG